MEEEFKRWWGEFDVPPGKTARWRIGPLRLYAWHGDNEWRVAFHSGADSLDPSFELGMDDDPVPDDPLLTVHRYAFAPRNGTLRVTPRMADRAMVVQPATPLFVPAGQKTTLYVSTATWLSLAAVDEADVELLQMTIHRPSDTWFGSSTRFGELCYSSKTLARTRSDQLVRLPHRAITPILIKNNGTDLLPVEQLRVPARNLRLYEEPGMRLWTDTVVFDRKEGQTEATLSITASAVDNADFTLLAPPRTPLQHNVVVRAFSKLFG